MSQQYVTTFIADKSKHVLEAEFIRKVRETLTGQGVDIEAIDWLAAGVACDVTFSQMKPEVAEPIILELIGEHPVDCVIQPVEDRRRKMLISDMDSTMITVECIDELADFVGKKAHVAAITDRAMNGELDFKTALAERVKLLAGLPESVLQEAYDSRVQYMSGAKQLVATMRKHGAHCVLVSGGFTFFTSRVRDALGFHMDSSNQLEIKNGRLTGEVILPILDKVSKLETMKAESAALNITLENVLAVGDGANDLPMLLAAGLGVAYHAKPNVRAAAHHRIIHTDLASLLYVQGYKQEEIINGHGS